MKKWITIIVIALCLIFPSISFSTPPSLFPNDTPFGATWDGNPQAATKNVIYDQFLAGAAASLVGDCTVGPCLDGTSDGGTWIKFYDAQGATQLIGGNTLGAIVLTLPIVTGTLASSADKLSVFSATSSSELFGVISNETGGTGVLVGSISPVLTTDATIQGLTGAVSTLNLTADAGEDNSDKWKIEAADGGNMTIESYTSGSWVAKATLSNAGLLTVADLATATTIGTKYIYRAEGTDVIVADGGTGASTLALNGILYGNNTSAVGVTVIGAEGQILRAGASPFVPAWTTSTFADTYAIGTILHAGTANVITGLAAGAEGTLLMGNGAGAPSFLAAGASNEVLLGAGAADPVWSNEAAFKTALNLEAGTDFNAYSATLNSLAGLTETNGGIAYGTADNAYAWLAAGTANYLLQGNGAAAPTWTNAPTVDGTNLTGTGASFTAGAVSTITGLAPDTATTQATQASITTAANLTTVGALNAGSITSGFGSIDVGASPITTSGTNTAGVFIATGNISGNVPILSTTSDTNSLTAVQMRGYIHINGDADAIDWTLPSAAQGLSGCFYALGNANTMTVDPYDGTDTIWLNGTTNTAGDAIDSAAGAGDFICLVATDTTNWHSLGRSGVWTNGGTD